MPFKLPENYRALCSNVESQARIEDILTNSDRRHDHRSRSALPPDLDWKDLPAFHRDVLSAHQVRCEYAVHMVHLWDTVWQPALDECDFVQSLRPWTIVAAEKLHQRLDTNTVWREGWFGREFDIDGTNFHIGPGVYIDWEQAWLSLSFKGRDNTDHTTGRHFGDDWPAQENGDGYAGTAEDLAPIRADGTIDLDPLHRAAADALSAISMDLRD